MSQNLTDAEAARDSIQKVIDDLTTSPDTPSSSPNNPVTSVTLVYADGSTVDFGVAVSSGEGEQPTPPSGAPDTGSQVHEVEAPHEPAGTAPEGS